MGKYVDLNSPDHDIEIAKSFVKAFCLWFEFDFFDDKNGWLIVKISYVNDHFFKEELRSAIKFFMQFYDYSFICSTEERKPIFENE